MMINALKNGSACVLLVLPLCCAAAFAEPQQSAEEALAELGQAIDQWLGIQ